MASLFTHPFLPVGLTLMRPGLPRRFFWFLLVLTILPDIDVVAFKFGIPYASPWGHRGFTHSVTFALAMGALGAGLSKHFGISRWQSFSWCSLATISHAVLDAMTTGGLGVAVFWPLSYERFFLPWQVIAVSPIGVGEFLGQRGLRVLASEVLWVWLPTLTLSFLVRFMRGKFSRLGRDKF